DTRNRTTQGTCSYLQSTHQSRRATGQSSPRRAKVTTRSGDFAPSRRVALCEAPAVRWSTMNVLLITIDSLNRHFLRVYGQPADPCAETPNLDALARRATVFDRHYAGSLPCMPARREFLAGVQEFLWRGWGATEPYDVHLAAAAAEAGCATQLIADHYHYWEHGGRGYVEDFQGWEFVRGQEFDPWKLTPAGIGALDLARAGIVGEAGGHRDRRQY